jgi:hypothetical protein
MTGALGTSWNNNRLDFITDTLKLGADFVKDNCVSGDSSLRIIITGFHVRNTIRELH